jgi:D-3-phosphoglycerate dehydrogenase
LKITTLTERPAPQPIPSAYTTLDAMPDTIPKAIPNAIPETMPGTVEALVLDLLEWVGTNDRPYAEVLDAWRTSCPRLPVWEDATEQGFIERRHDPGRGAVIAVSTAGQEHLRRHRRPSFPS